MTTRRLGLTTESGRELTAEVRLPRGLATDATIVQVFDPERPRIRSFIRVFALREIHDHATRAGLEDNDPLSLGHGNIGRVLTWIDKINEEGGA